MSVRPATDEAGIEQHLLELAGDVDRAVDNSGSWGCLLYLLGIVAFAFAFGQALTYVGAALLAVFVGFILFAALATNYDNWKVRRAVREFDTHYPTGSEVRPLAERVLRELQSEGKGLPKFRAAVLDKAVRRVSQAPIEAEIRELEKTLRNTDGDTTDEPPTPVTPEKPPQKAAPETPRHMPLEPFEATPGPKREGEGP